MSSISYRSLFVLSGLISIAGCAVSLSGQIVYPESAFWISIEGQKIDTSTLYVTKEQANRALRMRQPLSAGQKYSTSDIEQVAQSIWCDNIKQVLVAHAQQAILARFGVVVSKDEVLNEFRRESMRTNYKSRAELHDARATALQLAFSDVLRKEKSAEQSWENRLKDKGIPLNAWLKYVATLTTEEDRSYLVSTERQVAAAYRQTTPWNGFSDLVALRKLEVLIDQDIARNDMKFAQYLKETHASELRDGKVIQLRPDGDAQLRYIKQVRSEWWDRQYASLIVLSSDPQLGKSCGINWLAIREN